MPGIYIEYVVWHTDTGHKFKVGDCVRISNLRALSQKATLQIGQNFYY